jgi:hypothetical protein
VEVGVEEHHPPEIEPCREEQVRALGFDPGQLTPDEQLEVINIHFGFVQERWGQGERAVG